jgi:mRNA-degrading endonuclease RelE of RelBE toxin-antitoxin system
MRIFDRLLEFDRTGRGDVKDLQGELAGSRRLRVGTYRVIFSQSGDVLHVYCVKHRSEAYR